MTVDRTTLDAVARGERPADLVVRGGEVLCPDGQVRERAVAVVGDRVAGLLPAAEVPDAVGPDTRTVDATDRTVVPGFVDAHDHVDVHHTFERGYHRRLERGTTAVVTETSSFVGVGVGGIEEFLAATADLPVATLACVSPQPLVDTFEPADAGPEEARRLRDLLARDRVVAVGETDWIHVVGRDTPALDDLFDRARREGARVVGHGAGCRGPKLRAVAGAVDDDHEATDPGGVEERLAAGLHVVGRRGSIRDDLDAIATADRPRGDVSLCTDGTWPGDGCGMDDVLRGAVAAGIDPVEAVEMATRNPAAHFGLDDRGTIAPGNRADLVVLDDLRAVEVDTVLAGGEVVVEDGDALVGPRPHDYPAEFRESVALPDDAGDRLRIPATAGRDGAVRAIDRSAGLVTRETTVEPPVEDGAFVADPDRDLLKAALFDRRPGRDAAFAGFVLGIGLDAGAAATTLTWELPGLLVVGADDRSMRRAAARVAENGGGWAVAGPDPGDAHGGKGGSDRDTSILAEIPMPIAGALSDGSRDEVAEGYRAVDRALADLGGTPDPGAPRAHGEDAGAILGLQTLSFPGVPVLKLSLSGYAHVVEGRTVGLDPGEG
ncbi:adenine deaminase [Halobacteriales archaeon QS_8_69_26]|nr:MAG: adenine deaminase [Halobacteriales archaeon QS_8_69_26]